MRRLCLGGSFNPIHHGHLITARAVAEARGYDRVVLIPSAVPPHKLEASGMVSPRNRAEMCRLAVENDGLFDVDDLELARPGPSYTLDTARELRRRGWDRVDWLIGADMVPGLTNWHQPHDLLKEVTFVVARRPGHDIDWNTLSDVLSREMQKLQAQVVDTPQIDISGTLLRTRLAAGQSIRYLTPDPVIDYITRHNLYR